jgi:hypothetical protein
MVGGSTNNMPAIKKWMYRAIGSKPKGKDIQVIKPRKASEPKGAQVTGPEWENARISSGKDIRVMPKKTPPVTLPSTKPKVKSPFKKKQFVGTTDGYMKPRVN